MPRKNSKSDLSAAGKEPRPRDRLLQQADLTTADQIPTFEEAARRLGVFAHLEPEAELTLSGPVTLDGSFVHKIGPRKRAAGEPFNLAVDLATGITLSKKGRHIELGFRDEPQNKQIVEKLAEQGFSPKPGATNWASPASPEQIDAAYRLFNEFTGKAERYGVYRRR